MSIDRSTGNKPTASLIKAHTRCSEIMCDVIGEERQRARTEKASELLDETAQLFKRILKNTLNVHCD